MLAISHFVLLRTTSAGYYHVRYRRVTCSDPLALFVYAAPFSFAYLRIGAAVGALVLLGVVQLTMIGYALVRGERLSGLAWAGLALALFGLAFLTVGSAARPDPLGLLLMTVAGVAWAAYTIAGRSASDPIAANAWSFVMSSPLAILVIALSYTSVFATGRGIALALISGAITSGLGYAIWYRALPRLSVSQAAVAQLTVPISPRSARWRCSGSDSPLACSSPAPAVLSGVGLVLLARSRKAGGRGHRVRH